MTTKEQDFIQAIKKVIDDYGVYVQRQRAYYDGEREDIEFHVKDGICSISIEDLFDIK